MVEKGRPCWLDTVRPVALVVRGHHNEISWVRLDFLLCCLTPEKVSTPQRYTLLSV